MSFYPYSNFNFIQIKIGWNELSFWKIWIEFGWSNSSSLCQFYPDFSKTHSILIQMSNEGLCTKTGPLNCISYHLTRGSKYLFLQDLWQVYQNRSECHLMVFCIDRTTKACYDYIRIFGFSVSYLMWLRFLSVCLKALSYRHWSNLRLTVSDLNYWYFYGTQGSFWTIEEGMGT